jgi:hypothetical protein
MARRAVDCLLRPGLRASTAQTVKIEKKLSRGTTPNRHLYLEDFKAEVRRSGRADCSHNPRGTREISGSVLGGQTDVTRHHPRLATHDCWTQTRRGTMRRFVLALAIAGIVAGPVAARADGPSPTDQEIAQRIADSLSRSGQMKGYSIAVKYKNGTARLEGWVRSSQQMSQAVDIVRQAPEVQDVVNQLAIRQEPAVRRATPGKPATFPETAASQPIESEPQPAPIQNRYAAEAPVTAPSAVETAAYPSHARIVPAGSSRYAHRRARHAPQAEAPMADDGALPPPQGAPVPVPVEEQPEAQFPTQEPLAEMPVAQAPVAQQAVARQPVAHRPTQVRRQPVRTVVHNRQPENVPVPVQGGMQPPVGAPMGPRAGVPAAQYAGGPLPAYVPGTGGGVAPAVYDQPYLPNYAWPGYAAYPNYAAVTYPKQYSPAAWPYIGPFYPYPQVPLGWRKVTLEWDDGWWFLDFSDSRRHCCGH